MPWDTVPSASYERLNRVAPYVVELRARAARRIAAEKDFGYLAGDIVQRAERSQDKARDVERTRTLLATTATSYAITLENADSPGLPPAISMKDATSARSDSKKGRSADDITLREGERILADYVDLLAPSGCSRDRALMHCCPPYEAAWYLDRRVDVDLFPN